MCGSSSTTMTVPLAALTSLSLAPAVSKMGQNKPPLTKPSRFSDTYLTPPAHHLTQDKRAATRRLRAEEDACRKAPSDWE